MRTTSFGLVAHRRRIARATLGALLVTALLSVGADAATAPDQIDGGAQAPACPAERFRYIYPLTADQDVVDNRERFGLPTDPATRDKADADTERRGFENTFEAGLTLTDEENAAFWRFDDYARRLEPLRAYFDTIPDVTGSVAYNFDILDPLFTIQTLPTISAAQLAEIDRLTPADIPTIASTVDWTYAELLAFLYDIGAGARGEPSETGAFERIESLGLVPHEATLGAEQFVTVRVDESDLGCDEQLTALVAAAVADLDVPPIIIEQSGRATPL